jgi:hypothetical protein
VDDIGGLVAYSAGEKWEQNREFWCEGLQRRDHLKDVSIGWDGIKMDIAVIK